MASPFSGLVLGSGALLASPALYAGFVEATLPMETAVIRLVVAVGLSWIGWSLLGSLVTRTSEPPGRVDETHALPARQSPIRASVVDPSAEQPPN